MALLVIVSASQKSAGTYVQVLLYSTLNFSFSGRPFSQRSRLAGLLLASPLKPMGHVCKSQGADSWRPLSWIAFIIQTSVHPEVCPLKQL